MHLAAFVDDVAAADHRLTVHTDDLRSTIADALPAAAVSVEAARSDAPLRLALLDGGTLALRLGPSEALVVAPDLSLKQQTSNPTRTLGSVDETTFTVEEGSRALIDAATRGVASLATEVDTLQLGLGGSAGELSSMQLAPDGTAHIYGAADATGAASGTAPHPKSTAGELDDARFAVVDTTSQPGLARFLLSRTMPAIGDFSRSGPPSRTWPATLTGDTHTLAQAKQT